ncbi:MAG: cytochrome c peroxidase [Pseudomonadota bacterium]
MIRKFPRNAPTGSRNHRNLWRALGVASALALAGCGGDDNGSDDEGPTADDELRTLIQDLFLTGDPSRERALPDIDSPLADLGMKLFFTKALSGDLDTACVSCHHPVLGGGDGLSMPVGAEAEDPDLVGPGRAHSPEGTNYDGGPTVPRNASTTFNLGMWDAVLSHDGRVESLLKESSQNGAIGGIRTPDSFIGAADPDAGENLPTAQSRFWVTSPEEMQGFNFVPDGTNAEVREALELRLRGEDPDLEDIDWLPEFQTAFDDPEGEAEELVIFENIAFALGEYLRSQVFVDTPWKAFVAGDDSALSDDAKAGALLFFRGSDEGGADCANCHGGDFFTDESVHTLAVPQIGRGKGDENGLRVSDDFGRFRENGVETDRYAFRTPGLINVAVTGPWGHDGAYATLEGMVRHHLDPSEAVANYDTSQLEPGVQITDLVVNTQFALEKLGAEQAAGTTLLRDQDLSDKQVNQILSFLEEGLTDPCVLDRECLDPWIPGADDTDPDGLRLEAVDEDGVPL